MNKRVKWIVGTLLVLLLLVAGAVVGGGLYVSSSLKPVEARDEEIALTIPVGSNSSQIADLLEQEGLIRDAMIFTVYLKYKGEGSKFQAGNYVFRPGTSLSEIIARLNQGDTVKEDMFRFTIPEGFTVLQIADKLSAQGIVNRESFLQAADAKSAFSAGHPWVAQLNEEAALKHRLEGYMFPETYEMKKGSTEKEIIDLMLQEMDRKLDTLPANWQDSLKASGFTFHQLLTVASLVEREVVVDEERALVAGVILNRLKQNMKLQIDATVQYVLDKPKERLFEKDLQIQNPYNTYWIAGLPPGPIASPSLKSIQAVLTPASTDFLFYVTKKDGSSTHYFAKTYEQHLKNIELSNKKR